MHLTQTNEKNLIFRFRVSRLSALCSSILNKGVCGKMKRWSSLQRELYKIIDEHINFQIHLSKYRMNSQYGSTDLPRYWITLGNEIIFDYPKQFVDKSETGNVIKNLKGKKSYYPYQTDISNISELIWEYINTPKEEVFTRHFENDSWGLINILKSADKRFGKRRLALLKRKTKNKVAHKIIEYRLNIDGGLTNEYRRCPESNI